MAIASYFNLLPMELDLHIFSYLDRNGQLALSGVNRKWYWIANPKTEDLRCVSRMAISKIILLGEKIRLQHIVYHGFQIDYSPEKNLLATYIPGQGAIQFYRINGLKKKNHPIGDKHYGESLFLFCKDSLAYFMVDTIHTLQCDKNFSIQAGTQTRCGREFSSPCRHSSVNKEGCFANYNSSTLSITLFDQTGTVLQTFKWNEQCAGLQLQKEFLVAAYKGPGSLDTATHFILFNLRDGTVRKRIDIDMGRLNRMRIGSCSWDCNETTLSYVIRDQIVIHDIPSGNEKTIPITIRTGHAYHNLTLHLDQGRLIFADAMTIHLWKTDQPDQPPLTIPRTKQDGHQPQNTYAVKTAISICNGKIAIANHDCPFIELYDLCSGELLDHFDTSPAHPRKLFLEKKEDHYLLIASLSSGQTAVWSPGSNAISDTPKGWMQTLGNTFNRWDDIQTDRPPPPVSIRKLETEEDEEKPETDEDREVQNPDDELNWFEILLYDIRDFFLDLWDCITGHGSEEGNA